MPPLGSGLKIEKEINYVSEMIKPYCIQKLKVYSENVNDNEC